MSSFRKAVPESDDEQSYDLGELELAPRRTPHPQPSDDSDETTLPSLDSLRAPRPANDVTAPPHAHGRPHLNLDPLDGLGLDDKLELDIPHDDPVLARSGPPRKPSAPEPISARPARLSTPQEEEQAARRLSGYGVPPRGLVGAAGYVFHVAKRAISLQRARSELEQRTTELARAHETALTELGRALAAEPATATEKALADVLARVRAAETELAQREDAARTARAVEQASLAQLDEKRTAIEGQLAPYLAAERKAASEHQRSDAELKRKRAQQQRLDIELRAALRATVPPPPARRTQLETEAEEKKRELEAAIAAHGETERALGIARRELSLRRGSLDATERDQAQRRGEARALETRLEQDVGSARQALAHTLGALAELATAQGLVREDRPESARVAASEFALDEQVAHLAAYDRALRQYDRATLVRGILVWLVLFSVALLAITSL